MSRPAWIPTAVLCVTAFCAATLAAAPRIAIAAEVTAIRFGRLIDGRGGVTPDAVVIVEGDRIRARGPASHTPIPSGAAVLDLSKFTSTPT